MLSASAPSRSTTRSAASTIASRLSGVRARARLGARQGGSGIDWSGLISMTNIVPEANDDSILEHRLTNGQRSCILEQRSSLEGRSRRKGVAMTPTIEAAGLRKRFARLFGQDARSARANSARVLGQLGLADAAGRLARTYSGGMRRKLDLGASLVGAPRLLLLDEPTTGLDPRSRIELWDAISGLVAAGTDVLLTTQYLDEADQLAGRIVIIDHGRAVAAGTPTELKQRAGRNVIEVHVRDRADLGGAAAALAVLDHGRPQVEEATRRVSVAVEARNGPAGGPPPALG